MRTVKPRRRSNRAPETITNPDAEHRGLVFLKVLQSDLIPLILPQRGGVLNPPHTHSVGRFFSLELSITACPLPVFCSIMARTLSGSPVSVMKPSASL